MATGKRSTPPHGTLSANFDPFAFQEDLFRVAMGESRLQPEHGYPLLELLRYAKLGFDRIRNKIPDGQVFNFEDRLTAAMQNAALVEIHNQAELRLLDRLKAQNCISQSDYESYQSDIYLHYQNRVSKGAYAAAEWLSAIQAAIAPRKRGRPANKLLPDEADVRDWQVVLVANSQISPPFDVKTQLQQCLEAIPGAVKTACANGILKKSTNPEKPYETHIKRISAKAVRWLGS